MSSERNRFLIGEDWKDIKDWGERVFASACLKVPHLKLEYQVPINGHNSSNGNNGFSVIDFRVTNLRSQRSKLVEVTVTTKGKLRYSRHKAKQLKNLENYGEPFVVLTLENLNSIARRNGKKSES